MSKYVDALLVVNNEQLTEIYPDLDWLNAFGKADDTLSNAARSISELITCDGYMNLDFNDVNTTLRNGGAAIISTGYGEGEHRVTKAIQDALNSPLLKNKDIFGSKHLLFNLYFSREAEEKFVMGEARELTSFIQNIDKDVDVIYGIGFDETLGNKIKITILAAGFELSIMGDGPASGKSAKPANPFASKDTPAREDEEAILTDTLKNVYGEDKVESIKRERASLRYIILQPDQFEDDAVIETFEHSPAYNRDKRIADEVRQSAGKNPATPQPEKSGEPSDGPAPEKPAATFNRMASDSGSKVIDFL